MLIAYILIIAGVIGYLASLKNKRFPSWLYILVAFFGALVGAGLSFGDSVIFLSFPILNIWTVPVVISILFSLVVFFADKGNMLGTILVVVAVLALIGVERLDAGQTIGAGIAGMAIVWFVCWLYYNQKGDLA